MGQPTVRRVISLLVLVFFIDLANEARAERQPTGFSPVEIEDPSGTALDRFFTALGRTAKRQPDAVTRIAHYGDSLIVGDLITRPIRRLFQKRYGDAGPGFVLAGRPWDWYRREGVRLGASNGWRTYRSISGGPRDHFYGFGGSTFVTRQAHQRVWVETTKVGGRSVKASSIEIHYLAQPEGGDLAVIVDDEHVLTLSTKRDETVSAFHTLRVPDGPHKVVLRTEGGGMVRLFGVALEREGPGVVYDALGINGACTTVMGRMNNSHLREQLSHRRPDLIVLTFGANESNRPGLVDRYRQSVLPAVRQLRRASQGTSCLIMAPMDRASRDDGGRAESNDLIPRIIEAQREIAAEVGCAYFDTFGGMGGEGSMRRWASAGLAGGDLVHPSPRGAELIGQGLFDALERAFQRHRARR